MAQKSEDKRWVSKFGQFIEGFGVGALAHRLCVHESAIYHWLRGSTSPHPANALMIQRLAKQRGIDLSLDDIYEHFRQVRSELYTPAALKPHPARV